MENTITTINPFDGSKLEEYEKHSPAIADKIIEQVGKRYKDWRAESFSKRAELMMNVADLLELEKQKHAELMALEMGKPISQGIAEVSKCAWVARYYAENAERFLKDRIVATEAKKSYVAYNPLGVIFAIMPWNFPYWQVFRFAAPNLMAGNTGLLKHSANTTGSGLAIESLFLRAGFPEDTFRTIVVAGSEAERLIDHQEVRAVTLTGSTPVGKRVASRAGAVMKKCVLELGGSDPYLILKDADLAKAARICAAGRLINSGQSCIAAKRFIVAKEVYDEFISLFKTEMSAYKMGNPLDETIQIGPQAREDLRREHQYQVDKSIAMGGRLLLGGYLPEGNGSFYPPTLITDVKTDMPVFAEETFGPIAAVVKFDTENEAIEMANQSEFGLGAAIFSEDIEKAEYYAKQRIESGAVFVNGNVKSDPRLPFGGVKESGFGRELSEEGLREFLNIKSIVVE